MAGKKHILDGRIHGTHRDQLEQPSSSSDCSSHRQKRRRTSGHKAENATTSSTSSSFSTPLPTERLVQSSKMSSAIPEEIQIFVRYRYVIHTWKFANILKKDPLAHSFFSKLISPNALLNNTLIPNTPPLTLYRASIKNKKPELFLADQSCVHLRAALAESMGPTRANESWKQDENRPRESLSGLVEIVVRNQEELDRQMAELLVEENLLATVGDFNDLVGMRKIYKSAFSGQRDATFLALDCERWEHDHVFLLEFGWSLVNFDGGKVTRYDRHVVVKENEAKRNGKYCPDARDHYDFGITQTLDYETLLYTLNTIFSTSTPSTPLFLICHDPRSDLTALDILGVPTYPFVRDISSTTGDVVVLDTQVLYSGYTRDKRRLRLELCCQALEVETRRLHNAGNDARYTLDVFEKLMLAT